MADILEKEIIERICKQIPAIVHEAYAYVLSKKGVKEEDLETTLHPHDIKAKRKHSGEKKQKGDGYNKLPHERAELIDWMHKLIKKRKETKLGDENEENKIFNVITQRYIKRSTCNTRKDCSLIEVEFEGDVIGFTDGGEEIKLRDSPQFMKFLSFFKQEEKSEDEDEDDEEFQKNLDEQLILQKLEEKPHTIAELKKVVPKDLKILLSKLEVEEKIKVEGKTVKLVPKEEDEEVYEEETEPEPED
jgi:hypothetical protein